ncbi:MAG: hypothetical protein WAX44_00365 [Minisyncoccia bacterium]
METLLKIIAFVGVIETIVLVVGIIWGFILWTTGVSPALYRLGNGLAKRKIAVFAKGDNVSSLRSLLTDSKLFREKNIFEITNTVDIGKAEEASVYLVFWHDWADDITQILNKKPDACALIVYAPYEKGRIPDEQMKNLDGKRHTAVTNFRGRLLNDIVTAMITTSYEK